MTAARTAYARRVRETYGRLDLEVLTPLSEQGEHPVVQLREVFVTPQVREDPPPVELPRELVQRMLESGDLGEEAVPDELAQAALERLRTEYLNRPTEDVLAVLAGTRGERVVLLGDPGSGKSTLARYLALSLVQDTEGPLAPLDGLVPLVVELRQYADGQWRERTFEDFLDHRHTVAGMSLPGAELRQLLARGEAVVVFDGLDELFDPGVRAATAERIAAFAARYERVRVVVTSRVIGYQRAALDGAGFSHFMLQDLDPGRIGDFARRWYTVACPADVELASRLVDRITSAVDASRPIRELAGNPLLLTILAIIGRRQALPRDRQGVYEHAVRVLVAHWDRDTKYLSIPAKPGAAEVLDHLDDRERLELLRLLARRMQEGTGGIAGNHIHAEDLETVFRDYFAQLGYLPHQCLAAARALRDQLRERNFILARYGSEVYGFVHRAFLEYLAAADLFQRYTVEREWTPEELIEEVFARRADDPAWHEVLLLVVNQLSEADAGRVVDHLLDRRDEDSLILAVRALAEVRKVGLLSAQSDGAIDRLTAALTTNPALGHTDPLLAALSVLGSVPAWNGRERYLRWFHLRGQFLALPDGATSVAVALHRTIEASLTVVAFGFWRTWAPAISALARRWNNHPDVVPWLLNLANRHPDNPVRLAATAELMDQWWDHPDVRSAFGERGERSIARSRVLPVRADPTEPYRSEVLAQLWAQPIDDSAVITNTLAWRSLLTAGPGTESREALARLTAGVVASESILDRRVALELLATQWGSHPEAVGALLDAVTQDASPEVRSDALSHYAVLVPEAAEAIVRSRAAADPGAKVRSRALTMLAWQWPGSPETTAALRHALANDPETEVREAAEAGLGAVAHLTADGEA
ncbi:HEAT repeat domain-containing protein [Kitasatospora sp. NPDC004799]|uniref:NACHT domain-containing protein n=1 Tax=Kitasatospora sp. NPDC004799 TaxID=3154460 RepID=UPI0033BC6C7D